MILDIAVFAAIFYLDSTLGEEYKIKKGDVLDFDTSVPITAVYDGVKLSQSGKTNNIGEEFDVQLKAFGIIPFSTVNVEVVDEKITNDVSANVGLMYVSDYAYATVTSNYNGVVSGNENWLNNGADSWFITRLSNNTRDAYYLRSNGNIANSATTSAYQIRPTFYLNGRQKYAGGNGTQANPYRIEV